MQCLIKKNININMKDVVESYLNMHYHPKFGKTHSRRKKLNKGRNKILFSPIRRLLYFYYCEGLTLRNLGPMLLLSQCFLYQVVNRFQIYLRFMKGPNTMVRSKFSLTSDNELIQLFLLFSVDFVTISQAIFFWLFECSSNS